MLWLCFVFSFSLHHLCSIWRTDANTVRTQNTIPLRLLSIWKARSCRFHSAKDWIFNKKGSKSFDKSPRATKLAPRGALSADEVQ